MNDYQMKINSALKKIKEADAIVIGAGSGLSTAAGFTYTGERFEKYFGDMAKKYGYRDMYSGGFNDYDTPEEMWAFWSRYVFINRYMNPPKRVYEELLELVKGREYFVLTTNVDHCFQKAGFDKERLFYTQGDYGLFQCSKPCADVTYDNEDQVKAMVLDQGYEIKNGDLVAPAGVVPKMKVSSELVPKCPRCGRPMRMNLREDNTFVEDEGWYLANERLGDFLETNRAKKILFLELGVGFNTPGIIKYPFWRYTKDWEGASYVCVSKDDAYVPSEIEDKSICIDGDIADVVSDIKKMM